jgi:hypothetical protein
MVFKEIKFNRQELSGAFGDIGTDLPLLIAIILAAGLYAPGVLIVFGLMQIFTGIFYKMPMPVQPLKAMATLVIAQQIAGNILLGAGLAIGFIMLILSLSGALDKISKYIPKTVIRGLQLGLGISLCLLAFQKYINSDGISGYIIAFLAFLLVVILFQNKKIPTSLILIAIGFIYALFFNVKIDTILSSIGFNTPELTIPSPEDIAKGFVLLALPQIPLSLGNSIFATKQVSDDLFPNRKDISIKKIGITYSLMNLIIPFLGGVPSCHGSGGMVGHYTFGGRTGGSVIIYGIMFIILGALFGSNIEVVIKVFPLPILGVILIFEGLALMILVKDQIDNKKNLIIVLLVGIISAGLPYGFVISMVIGITLYYLPFKLKLIEDF